VVRGVRRLALPGRRPLATVKRREVVVLCVFVLALVALFGVAASGDLVGMMVELEYLIGGK